MLEIIKIDTIKHEIEEYRAEVNEVLQYTKSLEIKSQWDVKRSIDYVARARDLKDQIDEKRKELTKDAKDFCGKVSSLAKAFTEPLSMVEDMIVQKIEHYRMHNEEDIIDLLPGSDEMDLMIPSFQTEDKTRSDLATLNTRISHTFELQDANLVPREYLVVDEKKVNLALKNGIRTIPGLLIQEHKTIHIRRT